MRQPFQQTVCHVCTSCNSGWMSRLESVAQRVLSRLILDEAGMVELSDQSAIAAWVQKTALVAMLVSSEEERASGYGLPVTEYRALYALRDELRPLPASRFWIGRYDGERTGAAWVTPLVLVIDELPEPTETAGIPYDRRARKTRVARSAVHYAKLGMRAVHSTRIAPVLAEVSAMSVAKRRHFGRRCISELRKRTRSPNSAVADHSSQMEAARRPGTQQNAGIDG